MDDGKEDQSYVNHQQSVTSARIIDIIVLFDDNDTLQLRQRRQQVDSYIPLHCSKATTMEVAKVVLFSTEPWVFRDHC